MTLLPKPPEDAETLLVNATAVLDWLPQQVEELSERYGHQPLRGSMVSAQYGQCPRPDLLQTAALSGANLIRLVAKDHVQGLRRALTAPVLNCTPWTCARGVVEACSGALWLLDSEIDSTERVSRSLNLRLEDINSQLRLYRKVTEKNTTRHVHKPDENTEQGLNDRITHLRKCARDVGIQVRFTRGGKLLCFGAREHSISSRISDTLDAAPDYAILSQMAHGNTSALIQLSGSIHRRDDGADLIPGLPPWAFDWLLVSVVIWSSRTYWGVFQSIRLGTPGDR